MPMNDPTITDHESILLLRQDVKALKESQDGFHKEMKESFKDLKDNYATRLDVMEKGLNDADNAFVAKAVQDKINEEVEKRVKYLEMQCDSFSPIKKLVYGGISFILLAVLSAVVYLVVPK
jgi:BMFP domain-containing protein YqiC